MTAFLAVCSTIYGIVSAIPVLDKWLKLFVLWYTAQVFAKMEKDKLTALSSLLNDKDQRLLEQFWGYSNAGKPVPIPDSDIVDGPIPGMPNS